MSHYMTALAMKQTGLKPAAKIVLYWLADHHNETTGACFPSLNTLAKECEMNRTTVVRHLDDLERNGLIQRTHRVRDNGSQTSTEYYLNLSPVAKRNSPCCKTQQPPVAKCDPHNLGNNNLGNEQVYSDQTEFGLDDKPPKQKSRLPEGWRPDEEMTEYARNQKLNDDEIQRIADDFFAYWDDQPKSKSSKSLRGWRATWRNRVDSVAWRYVKNRGMAQQSSPGGYGQGGSIASVVARRRLNGEV